MNETVTEVVEHIQATRYLTSKFLINWSARRSDVLLYDHLLTFSTEVELIWAARWSVPKVLFLLLRYIVPPSVIIHTHFLVLLHLWNLLERRPRFICCTLALLTLTTIANIACTTIVVLATNRNVHFDADLRACAIRDRDRMPLLWAPPRSLHSDVGKIMYRDGMVYFLLQSVLYFAPFLCFLTNRRQVSLVLLGVFFIWSSTTVTVTRLILNLRELRVRTAKLQDGSAPASLCN
ncbi:hypothetical protein F5146DRAFT_1052828 [Armillaria mellea]|nr:hypothetical protein F5146DRAFT_1052828 [Armillaria mellea]